MRPKSRPLTLTGESPRAGFSGRISSVPRKTTAHKLFHIGALCSALLILLLLAGTADLIVGYRHAAAWVDHTTQVITEIRATRGLLTGTRPLSGSVLQVKVSTILDQFDRVAALTGDNPRQVPNVAEFRSIFFNGPARKPALTDADVASATTVLDRMQHQEENLLVKRVALQTQITRWGFLAGASLCCALLTIGLLTAFGLRRELGRRARAEAALVRDKEELTRYTAELAQVSAGSKLIQAARDERQLHRVVEQVMRELVPASVGYFAVIADPNDPVEICGAWGYDTPPAPFFPAECMALQLGTPIHRRNGVIHIDCAHEQDAGRDHLCIPVHGASGHMGVLHVAAREQLSDKRIDVISVFAGHVGLGLSNLRMREALRQQSVRDSLTGLSNRRYFDDSLRREMAAANRHGVPLSVVLLDVDYFKQLNDTQGHTAGDHALHGIARILTSSFREGDVVCRYGGEEFSLILPGTSVDQAWSRAEFCRTVIESANLQSGGRSLGSVTVSMGIAGSGEFGTPQEIIRAADAALYHAKRTGRNAAWICSDLPTALPTIPATAIHANWRALEEGVALPIPVA